MAQDYLEALSLSDADKAKVESLGAESPLALLSIIKASPDAFEAFLGKEQTAQVAQELETMIDEADRAVLDTPLPFLKTGAIMHRDIPAIRPPSYDIDERDRLFNELQSLRQRAEVTPDVEQHITELEERINMLLQNSED